MCRLKSVLLSAFLFSADFFFFFFFSFFFFSFSVVHAEFQGLGKFLQARRRLTGAERLRLFFFFFFFPFFPLWAASASRRRELFRRELTAPSYPRPLSISSFPPFPRFRESVSQFVTSSFFVPSFLFFSLPFSFFLPSRRWQVVGREGGGSAGRSFFALFPSLFFSVGGGGEGGGGGGQLCGTKKDSALFFSSTCWGFFFSGPRCCSPMGPGRWPLVPLLFLFFDFFFA